MMALVVLSIALYALGYYRMPFVYGGFLLQVAYMVLRGMELGRLPLVGPHDTLFFSLLRSCSLPFPCPLA